MKSSQRLIDYLKKTEGYSGVAYKCPAGVWTIGFGHTAGVAALSVMSFPTVKKHFNELTE